MIAPEGWGKSTLLADWARRSAPARDTAVSWLTLDDSDDEPHRFWTYLLSALRTADPTLGDAALKALRVTEVDPLEVAVPTLLNDLAAAQGSTASCSTTTT